MAYPDMRTVQGRPYHRARRAFAEQLHHLLAEAVVERREALMNEMEEGFEDILARADRSSITTRAPPRAATSTDCSARRRSRTFAIASRGTRPPPGSSSPGGRRPPPRRC